MRGMVVGEGGRSSGVLLYHYGQVYWDTFLYLKNKINYSSVLVTKNPTIITFTFENIGIELFFFVIIHSPIIQNVCSEQLCVHYFELTVPSLSSKGAT